MPLRLGLLGCGMIAQAFAKAARTDRRFEVTAVHSLSTESMVRLLEFTPAATRYSDRTEFLNAPNVDGVVVCTPHALHVTDAADSMVAGKHVLIEKPIATSLADLTRLEMVTASTTRTVLALPHSHYPFLDELRRIIASQVLGRITALHSVLDVPGPPRSNWYYSASAVGGASLDTLPYALCRMLDLAQMNVRTAIGHRSRLLSHRSCLDGGHIDSEVDDAAALTLELSSGQLAFVRSTWNSWTPDDYILVCGRRGEAKVDCGRNVLTVCSDASLPAGGKTIFREGAPAVEYDLDRYNSELLKLNAFHQAVQEGRSDFGRVAYAMRLILGIPISSGAIHVPPKFYNDYDYTGAFSLGDDYV
jgi:predicted dehydrogenase